MHALVGIVVTVLITFPVVFLEETSHYCGRLSSFPLPDFRANFTLRSQNGKKSFKEIRHGLNVEPFYVRVYAKAKSGANGGFCFNGVGGNQASSRSPYGGLIFAYNSEHVRIWAPTNNNGFIIFIKDGWGGEKYSQQANEAQVFVEIWKAGPEPNFQIDSIIGRGTLRGSYGEVDHRLRQIPDRIIVRVTPENHLSPNGGFWFNAVSSSQNSKQRGGYGGVIFAYSERIVRLWAPNLSQNTSGCILINDFWGGGKYSQRETRCRVNVQFWVNQWPVPSFQTVWLQLKSQRGTNSFKEISHNLGQLPEYVSIQIRSKSGMNANFIFHAAGSVQTGDDNNKGYGGVTYAYDENKIRIWAPSRNDGSKTGYVQLVKNGWGDNLFLLNGSSQAMVRILVYGSNCNGTQETLYQSNTCVRTSYLAYGWKTSPWSTCSSVCNPGRRTRKNTGCRVTSKITLDVSCDFEKDMCGWSSSGHTLISMSWRRTNGTTPTANTGPLWGHPKGSYYVYTNSIGVVPDRPGFLDSPSVHGRTKCHLTFYWNMFGRDVGTLSVLVNQHLWGGWWDNTGWSMIGTQGQIYWRAAYVNLERFVVYRIRFEHLLPRRPVNCRTCSSQSHITRDCLDCIACPGNTCPEANVAIDNIKLMCEGSLDEEPAELCRDRSMTLAGCEQFAQIRDKEQRGPAYSEVPPHPGNPLVYIRANGSKGDIIGKYFFDIHFTADYMLWMNVNSSSKWNNDVDFRVDEGDWIDDMRTSYISSHVFLWHVYRFKSFPLHAGRHSITFRQKEKGFQFDRFILAPKSLSTWTDLGLQSRHIPDSYLFGHPVLGSKPEPRFARLNAAEAWCSSDHNVNYVYLQVRLPDLALVSRIAIQGGQDVLQKTNNYWIKSYKLQFSLNGFHYSLYRDRSGSPKVFLANSDASTIKETVLDYTLPVRGVRIYPYTFEHWICLRLELYGIYLSSALCATSGPERHSTEHCMGDRDCGPNARCQRDTQRIPTSHAIAPTMNSSIPQESCLCFRGYHGDSCQHFGCTPNPCNNQGTCTQGSANRTFTCACSSGYYGNTCQHPCPSGRYGNNCTGTCLCTQFGSCDSVTGSCHCLPGYVGPRCQDKCAIGYYGYRCSQKCQCENGASCDRRTGACNCTVGWTGVFCQQPCPRNTWGKGCVRNCSCAVAALKCDRSTGECICPPGWYGSFCELECPNGFYGRNCTYRCNCAYKQTCSRRDGLCNCTVPGVTGVTCNQPCRAGFYGVDCKQKCACANGADCDHVTGHCTCPAGFTGPSCASPCSYNTWGFNCSLSCNCTNGARCHAVTGECACSSAAGCTCHGGWSGRRCREPCGTDSWGPGCKNLCPCSENGVCDSISGKCLCHPGYTGDKCQSSCNLGNYGINCTLSCPCNSNSSQGCDVTSGACKCSPGWYGWSCDLPCPRGSWGLNCWKNCSCANGSCDPITGQCACNRGWKGRNCDRPCKSCGTPCPLCFHSNGTCDAVTGKCTCNDGYLGDACLEACPVGYYGNSCKGRCSCLHGNCHPATGTCECQAGWTGQKCDQACPSDTYGYNCTQHCACVHGNCNVTDGSCTCEPGYHGNSCEKPCTAGQYGADCRLKCNCMNGAVCDRITGRCSCGTGWTGRTCNVSCSAGRYGVGCQGRCKCKLCDRFTGNCRCAPGYQGVTCTQPCPGGYYGNNCSKPCACANNGTCNHVTGTCTCLPGWTRPRCDDPCPAGRYGLRCEGICACDPNVTDASRPCDHVTGTCNCNIRYQGPRCQEQCQVGRYGKDCSGKCECQNGGQCRSTDGVCLCTPGYHGNKCQLTCPNGRYGVKCNGTCQCFHGNTRLCDRIDGSCVCADGYIGVLCENSCPEGKYGAGCHSNCNCLNGAHCDHVTGSCACTAGFKGQDCGTECGEGAFGPGCSQKCLCENGGKCNRITGDCTCTPGYTGLRCSRACPEGRYGLKCANICDCNTRNTKRCDAEDGTCHCDLGFTNRRCDKPCKDGFYGQNCVMECPSCSRHVTDTCNKQHGNCTCAPGFHGYECHEVCARDRYGLRCHSACSCSRTLLCDHVKGTCMRYKHGIFSVIINETLAIFDTINRRRDLRMGLEEIMAKYYEKYSRVLASTNKKLTQAQLKLKPSGIGEDQAASLDPGNNPTPSQRPNETALKHDFVARILELESVQLTKKLSGVRALLVLLDKGAVVSSSTVREILNMVPHEEISIEIAAQYYTGALYQAPPITAVELNLPSIIGATVGVTLVILILVIFKLMRHRYHTRRRAANYRKAKKDHAEFELQPCLAPGNTSHLLVFDNPYYDILAAMGLDDDVEEEYYNPLYDDISVCSDSYNSNTDDSCHKELSHMVLR